jgi:hypothetical protein
MATSPTPQRRNVSPVKSKGTTQLPSHPPVIALIVYPLTLLLGSLYSIISPTARQSRAFGQTTPLAPTIASDINLPPTSSPSPSPVNYFARKDNIFNVYFVKVGWAWTTLAFLSLLLTQPLYTNSCPPNLRLRRITQALLRYAIVTVSWFLMTQWFFGPAVIDRTFTLTGGKCEHLDPAAASDGLEVLKVVVTAAACKTAGGAWHGGHDVSGHVFMLVLSSAFLAFEALGAMSSSPGSRAAADVVKEKQDPDHGESPAERGEVVDSRVRIWVMRFVWAVALLSWWMLFMTAIWFHTWLEKVRNYIFVSSLRRNIMFFWLTGNFVIQPGVRFTYRYRYCICYVFSSPDALSLERHYWSPRRIDREWMHCCARIHYLRRNRSSLVSFPLPEVSFPPEKVGDPLGCI